MRYYVLLCLVLVTKATRHDNRCAGFTLNEEEYECDGQTHEVKTGKAQNKAIKVTFCRLKQFNCQRSTKPISSAKICDEALQCGDLGGDPGRIKVLSLNTTRTEALDKVKCRCNGLKQCDITKSNVCSDDSTKEEIKKAEVEYICKTRGKI